jgi:hypothetical protein
MSTSYFLKNAARVSFILTVFWNSDVLSLEGMVRRAATFQVMIFRPLGPTAAFPSAGRAFFRRGGDIGAFADKVVSDGQRDRRPSE